MSKEPKEIFCPKCNKFIPTNSEQCPKCGYEITDEERQKAIKSTKRIGCFAYFLIAMAILWVIGYFTKDENKTDKQTAQVQVTENAQTGEVTITVTDDDNSAKTAATSQKADTKTENQDQDKNFEKQCVNYKKDFIALYNELMSFRYKSDFHKLGFSGKSPYHSWMQRVEELGKKYPKEVQLQTELVSGELSQMGLVYMRNNGNDDEITEFFLKDMKKAMKK